MVKSHKQLEIIMWDGKKELPNLREFDGIYIGGGSTYKLLKKIQEKGVEKKLSNFYKGGGKIFGGSAGAIIWGKDINIGLICSDKDENKAKLKYTSGFNLLKNYDIQVHFTKEQIKKNQEYSSKTGRPIIGIPEETAVILQDKKIKVIGEKPIYLINQKEFKEIGINSEIDLNKL